MFNQSPCAGGFGNPEEINFCAPLQQLFNEHPSLLAKMDAFYKMVLTFEKDRDTSKWNEAIDTLHEKLEVFVAELEPHSNREEDILFEMMVKYIGREGGPIAVMEYEHHTAKLNLKAFFDKVAQIKIANENISMEKGLELIHHVKIVYATLTEHFKKEEQILFPMAEKMLTQEEKQSLEKQFLALK